MYKKYQLWFDFFDTMEQAENYKRNFLKTKSSYYRRNKRISILPWTSSDGSEHKIIMWYYIQEVKMKELLKKFWYDRQGLVVNKKFVNKYKLSNYDINELYDMLLSKNEYETTINSKLVNILKDYNFKITEEGIGWKIKIS